MARSLASLVKLCLNGWHDDWLLFGSSRSKVPVDSCGARASVSRKKAFSDGISSDGQCLLIETRKKKYHDTFVGIHSCNNAVWLVVKAFGFLLFISQSKEVRKLGNFDTVSTFNTKQI